MQLKYSNFIKSNEIESQGPQNIPSLGQTPPTPRRIIGIGDLHGDYKQTIKVLSLANMIDHNDKWCGDNGILVQTVN